MTTAGGGRARWRPSPTPHWSCPDPKCNPHRKEQPVNGNYIVWTIVGILAAIALVIWIAPHVH